MPLKNGIKGNLDVKATMAPCPVPAAPPPFTRVGPKVGRNDACPCGSGKKYKHCHGRI